MGWDKVMRFADVVGCNLLGRYFMGGKSVKDVLETGKNLKKQGFKVTYNLLGEHEKDPDAVEKAMETTFCLFNFMNPENEGNISCKPTLYGLEISKELFKKNIAEIIELANKKRIEVEFDAENYTHVSDTFEVFNYFASQSRLKDSVRQAVQAHLVDIFSLMSKYELWDKSIRIVKGSDVYEEANSYAGRDNEEAVTKRYFEILRYNVGAGKTPFVATIRDGRLAESVTKLVQREKFIFEFQMLYGPLGRRLEMRLLKAGYPVRIYTPFTDSWCCGAWKPYGLRRAKMIRRVIWDDVVRKVLSIS